ncbi:uncharacterized protein VTP21DRAFT_1981 [Calcarisporiella thermophila]|uniref:uncharacterized protein n=1 Tax=Calcarisporiella thermophila TaxID=911321 RepID=UPI00374329DE
MGGKEDASLDPSWHEASLTPFNAPPIMVGSGALPGELGLALPPESKTRARGFVFFENAPLFELCITNPLATPKCPLHALLIYDHHGPQISKSLVPGPAQHARLRC